MKKVMLYTTGGTIASKHSDGGLIPMLHSNDIVKRLTALKGDYLFDHENLMDLDSSNIQPEEWKIIARKVYNCIEKYDGFIITHGTDTMAYTASALSFMLQNLNKPVVLTGSQLPIDNPLTDAITNLYTAIEAIANDIVGVTVAFNRKIINGTRTVKVSTMGFDAFESVNAEYMGKIFADGIRVYSKSTSNTAGNEPAKLIEGIDNSVFLLKLLPGTNPEIFDMLSKLNYRGIVVEAFGAGGLHYINRDLLSKLEMLISAGIAIVVCSQCLYERSDLSIYEVGQRLLSRGVISGRDMTSEAASTKLMWALGQTADINEVEKIFCTNYAGEITL